MMGVELAFPLLVCVCAFVCVSVSVCLRVCTCLGQNILHMVPKLGNFTDCGV